MRLPKALSSIQYLFVANIVYASVNWLVLVTTAKATGATEVGALSLVIAVVSPVFAFFNMEMRNLQVTHPDDSYSFHGYFLARLLLQLCAIVTIGLFFIFYLNRFAGIGIVIGFVLVKLGESLSDVRQGEYMRLNAFKRLALSQGARAIIGVGLFATALSFCNNLTVAALVWGGGALSVATLYDYRGPGKVIGLFQTRTSTKWKDIAPLIRRSAPLGLVVLINTLNINVARYILSYSTDLHTLGIYSAIAQLLVIGATLVNAIGQYATRSLSVLWDTDRLAHNKLAIRMILAAATIGLAGILFALLLGKPFLTLVYTTEYAQKNELFIAVMIAAMFLFISTSIGITLTSRRIIAPQAGVNLMTFIVNAIFTTLLIHYFGVIGAPAALVASYCVKMVGQLMVLQRYSHPPEASIPANEL